MQRVTCGLERTSAGAAGPHPASGEGRLVLTTALWSQTTATGIPEGFHSGLPCSPVAIRAQRVPGAAGGAGATGRVPPASLFQPRLPRARPRHTGLFVRAQYQLPVESLLVAGAEPEQLDALQIGMVQNALHDLGPDLLALIGRIHDHVPDRRPVHVVGQDPAESDQAVPLPDRQRKISVFQRPARLLRRPPFGPGRLLIELDEESGVKILSF